jgi:hypothetical protein
MPHFTDISMKNFITVGTRLAAAALFGSVLAGPANAACAFKANAPDQHLVVKHDTLWDISGAFLEHAWCWPDVWGLNKAEIRNPHWIYPGQIVYFDRTSGKLSLQPPGSGGGDPATVRLSPQLRTEDMDRNALRTVSPAMLEPFLTQPLIIENDELAGAPRIVAMPENGRVFIGKGDTTFVKGELKGGTAFQVFRPAAPLKDPESGKIVAYESMYLGTVNLKDLAKRGVDVHTFTVTETRQEMAVGDLLMPLPPTPLISYAPHAPERKVKARVLSIYAGVAYAGQNQIVSINRGSVDGIDVASVLQLYHFGKVVEDKGGKRTWLGMRAATVQLPDQQVGDLFIFRVFKNVSYGLIMQVTDPVQVGDVASSPE